MRNALVLLFITVIVLPSLGQDRYARIGLMRKHTVKSVTIMSAKGGSIVYADGERKGEIQSNDGLRIEVLSGGLSAKSLGLTFTARKRIEVVPRMADGGFRLRTGQSKPVERTYPGSLEMTVVAGALQLVNTVPLEDYTAGVVQAEAGNYHHQEYYKLQSVTCRTYALSNQRKHLPEGFELCDGVHCQVYHGKVRNDSIRMAVEATHGLVLVDAEIRLIHATFHSNCGGETVNAEDVWSKSEPYLRSTADTFCLASTQATWEKSMPRSEWLGYLKRKHKTGELAGDRLEAVLNYEPLCRDLYLGNIQPLVPLKQVREDLKLRSTYFSVHTEGEVVRLRGRGFGHGVGLCQEGSMQMARADRTYTDILHHYFTDVHLVDVSTLDFFREEAPKPGPSAPTGK
jgi:stage II sporulation protein D